VVNNGQLEPIGLKGVGMASRDECPGSGPSKMLMLRQLVAATDVIVAHKRFSLLTAVAEE
jgi:hypothetical protein